ncbi:MAG TPA: MFS transporter [Bradyrhizobium sp.]|nr:MFS transporter [Bradyrhizobium sp.]
MADRDTTAPSLFTALALLWFAGVGLRMTVLAVPPVIPLIHDDLRMTETQVGLLIGLPLLMFAVAAIPGSLLIARTGASRIAIAGLFIIALASAARSAAFDIWTLYAATALMGFGVAIMQPALPTLARNWVPKRIGLGSAVSTNGLMVGVAAGPALTIPFVLPAVGHSWRLDFLVWTVPVIVAALLFLTIAPRDRQNPDDAFGTGARRWWPDWKNPLLWLLALTFGSNNAFYYAVNAFLPDYLNSRGQGPLIAAALGWLNGAQLVASFVLLVTAERLQGRTWPYLVFGLLPLAGVLGIVFGSGLWIVAAATVVGFSLSVTFVMTFALPAMLSPPDQVHRMAGGMFTISYTIAVIVPVVSGALWDLTGVPWTVFIPVALCGVALTTLGFFLSMKAAAHP